MEPEINDDAEVAATRKSLRTMTDAELLRYLHRNARKHGVHAPFGKNYSIVCDDDSISANGLAELFAAFRRWVRTPIDNTEVDAGPLDQLSSLLDTLGSREV